jgi:DNA repair photolyase
MGIIYRPKGRAQEYSLLAINHYRGCGHGCEYCYGPDVTRNKDFFIEQSVRNDVLGQLRKEAPKFAGTDERVLLCFSCDPYQPLDAQTRTTQEVIKILREFDIPFQVLTKGGTWAVRDFKEYGPHDAFGTTLTFLDDKQSRKHEPHAALPQDRFDAIKAAKNAGIETFVSLEPVIDEKQSLEIIRRTHEFVDLFRIGKLNHKTSDIDWRKFGQEALKLCREFETDYYIKHDLAKHLEGISFCSIDKRKVKRERETKKTEVQKSLFQSKGLSPIVHAISRMPKA